METVEIVVAGHVCLDAIPRIPESADLGRMMTPGTLSRIGGLALGLGGAVANTGLALHRLGVRARLVGKVGQDLFGRAVLDRLRAEAPHLASGMIESEGGETSYTVVLNPPGVDRIFLHCPGANDTFSATDVDAGTLSGARLFHFGYPPLMRRMYEEEGRELAALLKKARESGAAVSLDLARPDANSPAGRAPWDVILRKVLPHVDIFAPSIDELLFMLDRPAFDRLSAGGDFSLRPGEELSDRLAERCLSWGAGMVLIKHGANGASLRTGSAARLRRMGGGLCPGETWADARLTAPCFRVDVAGTTGAGDCTIAGFLAADLRGLPPDRALDAAVGAGAYCVERLDATSGIPDWAALMERIERGWLRRSTA